MALVVFILKLAAYAFCLSVLIRQSYNLVFVMLRKPAVWIGIMAIIGFAHFSAAGWIGASVSLPFWATTLALAFNIPPRAKDEAGKTVDELYLVWGITRGKLKYRIGLFAMAIASLAGWVLAYGTLEGPPA